MRILFLSRWFPYPTDNGSKLRSFNLIKQLSRNHEVDLISFVDGSSATIDQRAMQAFCRRIWVRPYHPFEPDRSPSLSELLSPRPRNLERTYSGAMRELILRVVSSHSYEVVVASQIETAVYAEEVNRIPRIFEEVELATIYEKYARERHPVRRYRYALTWWKLSNYVARLLPKFEASTVVSERERELVHRAAPRYREVHVVPNGVDTQHNAVASFRPGAGSIVYSGSLTYGANFDAVAFFLAEILPLIQARLPHAHFSVTGSLEGVGLASLPPASGVTFTGYLDDIRPTIAASRVSVVPLRVGGGTRLKILESLALGTPVVSTRKGAEGLGLESGEEILIEDDPKEFAGAVIEVLQDDGLWQSLRRNGRRAVEHGHDWSAVVANLEQLIDKVSSAGSENRITEVKRGLA